MTAALTLHGVNCVRGERALFSGLDLQLPGGQLLCVAGASGAGKTGLLRMARGLLAPSSGEVHWRGGPLAAQPERWGREFVYLGRAVAPAMRCRIAGTFPGGPQVVTHNEQGVRVHIDKVLP